MNDLSFLFFALLFLCAYYLNRHSFICYSSDKFILTTFNYSLSDSTPSRTAISEMTIFFLVSSFLRYYFARLSLYVTIYLFEWNNQIEKNHSSVTSEELEMAKDEKMTSSWVKQPSSINHSHIICPKSNFYRELISSLQD